MRVLFFAEGATLAHLARPLVLAGQAARFGHEAILAAIRDYHATNGFAPGVRDLCAAIGIQSTSLMHFYLDRLERDGLILRNPRVARSIRVVEVR